MSSEAGGGCSDVCSHRQNNASGSCLQEKKKMADLRKSIACKPWVRHSGEGRYYTNEPPLDIRRAMNGTLDPMFSDLSCPPQTKLTGLSYFTVCGLVGTATTQIDVKKH